jgi:polar amino acid transport system substrate-binding protein
MKQVVQTLKTGDISTIEVPIPTLADNFILVQNQVSVISSGTEKTKVDMGKKNLLQKAKARPDLVQQVIQKIKTEGLKKTFGTVNSRLSAPSPLGYSCSGTVVACGGNIKGIKPGDRVACGGAEYAHHAEYVSVPKNLVVKVPDNVSFEEAAFATVGSISLQGVRLVKPELGAVYTVIGLGLLGQITVQLLKAAGAKVIATDLDSDLVRLAESFGAVGVYSHKDLIPICELHTQGHGVDAALVCAGSSSNSIIESCGKIVRNKGKVVVVGAVRMDIPREDYFKKEIEVVISRSYGPGRYDVDYEVNGNDYPYGYVRFTEQRNMAAFLDLVSEKKVNLQPLITHRFSVDEAASAYKLLEGEKKEPYIAITLNYDSPSEFQTSSSFEKIELKKSRSTGKLKASFIGAGNYATASLLPLLKDRVTLSGLFTSSGRSAAGVASKFGFEFVGNNIEDFLDKNSDALFITTRHDSHASYCIKGIESGKHVYVEKPLALTVEELSTVHKAYASHSSKHLFVGFNRRFAPLTQKVKEVFRSGSIPLVSVIRVNAGAIPMDHWVHDAKHGGGRIIGECCHFVDLAIAITGSLVTKVFATRMNDSAKTILQSDNVAISMEHENGSITTIIYTSSGSKLQSKERIEVYGGGKSCVIDDFKTLHLYDSSSEKKVKLSSQNKGQAEMLDAFLKSIESGEPGFSYDEIINASLATIMSVESLTLGYPLNVSSQVLNG